MRPNLEGPTSGPVPRAGFTPFSPWQSAHFWPQLPAPSLAVPLPGGRPVPSGSTSMFQAVMSASVIGWPSPGVFARGGGAPARTSTQARAPALHIDMVDLPILSDAPAGDAVVVLIGKSERARHRLLGLPARGDELGAGGVHVACFVPGGALQDCGRSIPAPGHAEAREGFRQYRLLQCCLRPALPAVG